MLSKSQISDELDTFITHDRNEVNVYLIGSMGYFNSTSFNPRLSDVDLLYIPDCRSLNGYVRHLTQAMKIAHHFDNDSEPVDVFFLNKTIAATHLSCLSMILSANTPYDEDLLFGSGKWSESGQKAPSSEIRQHLYKGYISTFLTSYLNSLPKSNTEVARKTAKDLFRALKMDICWRVESSSFEQYEKELFSLSTFEQLEPLHVDIDKKYVRLFDTILKTGVVEDWSEWMIGQELLAEQLLKVAPGKAKDSRFYASLCQIRELLMVRLKDIILKSSASEQSYAIEEYVNEAIGIVARLGVIGLDKLAEFDENTPDIVKKSFEYIISYLEGSEKISLLHLSASIVLLEYALEQGIDIANKNTLKTLLK